MKMELQFRSLREGHGADRQVVSIGGGALPTESDAVRVGDLLWIGGQIAADFNGPTTDGGVDAELDYIFGRIASLCAEGESSMSDLLRVRAFVTNEAAGYAFYAKLKATIPNDPPVSAVVVVPPPLHIPGCSITVDAVAYVQ